MLLLIPHIYVDNGNKIPYSIIGWKKLTNGVNRVKILNMQGNC
jgi:hypothetical protein